MTEISLLFLGAPTVLFDDRPYLFERTKSIALLSYLVVTARPQSRDWLAHLLWSDSKSGRTQVRVALAELTSTPLVQYLATTREQIGFNSEGVTTDIPTTTKSQSPVVADMDILHTIYRGDFLQGLTVKNAPDFERWQRTQTTRYRLWFESQLESIVQQCLRQEQYHLAIPHVEKVLEHDPLNERFCRYAILLWSKLSERHRAVNIYQRLQTELAPFDMQPEHTTQLLFQQLDSARWIQLQDIAELFD
ncbi:MAG: BTAD domain-containing putative transcriptional regulator [Chloroflexota bacterium]